MKNFQSKYVISTRKASWKTFNCWAISFRGRVSLAVSAAPCRLCKATSLSLYIGKTQLHTWYLHCIAWYIKWKQPKSFLSERFSLSLLLENAKPYLQLQAKVWFKRNAYMCSLLARFLFSRVVCVLNLHGIESRVSRTFIVRRGILVSGCVGSLDFH